MTGVNRDLVRSRAAEIRSGVVQIRRYAAQTDEAFFADARNLYSVQFLLLVTMEAAASLCNHILARSSRVSPASYAECLDGLHRAGIVDEDLAARLTRMARFRNLLVHRYWDVDGVQVLGYARQDLGDFEAYLAAIGEWLGETL
jgi:uncharacterized protein YutE (UPF0331/DUF86 family)